MSVGTSYDDMRDEYHICDQHLYGNCTVDCWHAKPHKNVPKENGCGHYRECGSYDVIKRCIIA